MSYIKTIWVTNQTPAITAANLNHIENGIENAHQMLYPLIDNTNEYLYLKGASSTEDTAGDIRISRINGLIIEECIFPNTIKGDGGWRIIFKLADEDLLIGQNVGIGNSGFVPLAIGSMAGSNNTGHYITVVGSNAGMGNTGINATGFGQQAVEYNTGDVCLGFGVSSLLSNSGDNCIGIGTNSGENNSGNNCIFLGDKAGKNNIINDIFLLKNEVSNTQPLLTGYFVKERLGISHPSNSEPQSTLDVLGSVGAQIREVTSSYVCQEKDYTIWASSGTFTIFLPDATISKRRILVIKNMGSGVITVQAINNNYIEDLNNMTLSQYGKVMIQSTGSNWIII